RLGSKASKYANKLSLAINMKTLDDY
ncbi:unnamed protein product, partial [Tetraodon nigroviridis]